MQGKKANIPAEELRQLLQSKPLAEIATHFNVSKTTIQRYKKKYKLSVNPEVKRKINSESHSKWLYNIHYFDKINTMNKAYLLGFICADGFVTDTNEVGIAVSEKDKGIVEFFQKELQTNKPIRTIFSSKSKAVELRLQNVFLANSIKKYGIVPRKSLILNIEQVIKKAQLTPEQISVFLLGYFDGDGCISIAHRKDNNKEYFEMNVTGTKETILYFYNYFDSHGCITKRHKDNKNNYTLSMSNNYTTIYNALKKIYCDCNKLDFFLQRKYEKFKKLEIKLKS